MSTKKLRLNNGGNIRKSLEKRGFGLFTSYWDDKISQVRIKARHNVEDYVNKLDDEMKPLSNYEKYQYMSELYYFLNGMISGLHTAMGNNYKGSQHPNDFEKLGYYTQENYTKIFDHFSRTWHNVQYDYKEKGKQYWQYSSHPYYQINAHKLIELANKLEKIGWTYSIHGYSDHFPSHTIKIVYRKMTEEEKSKVKGKFTDICYSCGRKFLDELDKYYCHYCDTYNCPKCFRKEHFEHFAF